MFTFDDPYPRIDVTPRDWPPLSWAGFLGVPRLRLRPGSRRCGDKSPPMRTGTRQTCSRLAGHTGRHLAAGTREVLAVWA